MHCRGLNPYEHLEMGIRGKANSAKSSLKEVSVIQVKDLLLCKKKVHRTLGVLVHKLDRCVLDEVV